MKVEILEAIGVFLSIYKVGNIKLTHSRKHYYFALPNVAIEIFFLCFTLRVMVIIAE